MEIKYSSVTGQYLGEVLVHEPSHIIGEVVEEEHNITKDYNHCKFTLRTAKGETQTFSLPELREAEATEKEKFWGEKLP